MKERPEVAGGLTVEGLAWWGRGLAKRVADGEDPAEQAKAWSLAPTVVPALARDLTAPLLSVADQRGAEVERSEKQHRALEHCAQATAAL